MSLGGSSDFGSAFVKIFADTTQFNKSLQKDLKRSVNAFAKEAEPQIKAILKSFGVKGDDLKKQTKAITSGIMDFAEADIRKNERRIQKAYYDTFNIKKQFGKDAARLIDPRKDVAPIKQLEQALKGFSTGISNTSVNVERARKPIAGVVSNLIGFRQEIDRDVRSYAAFVTALQRIESASPAQKILALTLGYGHLGSAVKSVKGTLADAKLRFEELGFAGFFAGSKLGPAAEAVDKFTKKLIANNPAAKAFAAGLLEMVGGTGGLAKVLTVGAVGLGIFAATLTGVGLLAVLGRKRALDLEDAYAGLTDVLVNRFGTAAPGIVNQFKAFNVELRDSIGLAQPAAAGVETLLLQYNNISVALAKRVTPVIADVSSRLGIKLPTAAKAVAKALQEPIRGLERLSRSLTPLSKEEKLRIEDFIDVGNFEGAQNFLATKLESIFSGAAEAASKTTRGKFKIATEQIKDLTADFGTALLPAFQEVQLGITKIVQQALIWFKTFAEGTGAVDFLAGALTALGKTLGFIADVMKFLTPLVAGLAKAFGTYLAVSVGLVAFNFAKLIAIPIRAYLAGTTTATAATTLAVGNLGKAALLAHARLGLFGLAVIAIAKLSGDASASAKEFAESLTKSTDTEAAKIQVLQGEYKALQQTLLERSFFRLIDPFQLVFRDKSKLAAVRAELEALGVNLDGTTEAEQKLSVAQAALNSLMGEGADPVEALKEAHEKLTAAQTDEKDKLLDIDKKKQDIIHTEQDYQIQLEKTRGILHGYAEGTKEAKEAHNDFDKAVIDTKQAHLGLDEALLKSAEANTKLADAQEEMNNVLNGYPPESEKAREAVLKLQEAEFKLTEDLIQQKEAAQDLADAQTKLSLAQRLAPLIQKRFGVNSLFGALAANKLAEAELGVEKAQFKVGKTAFDLIKDQFELDKQRKESQGILQGYTRDTDEAKKAIENYQGALINAKQAEIDVDQKRLAIAEATRIQNEKQEALNNTLNGYPPLSEKAIEAGQALSDAYFKMLQAPIDLEKAQGAYNAQLRETIELKRTLKNLESAQSDVIDAGGGTPAQRLASGAQIGSGGIGVPSGSQPQRVYSIDPTTGKRVETIYYRHAGGQLGSSQWSLVGERGPELFKAGQAGRVIPLTDFIDQIKRGALSQLSQPAGQAMMAADLIDQMKSAITQAFRSGMTDSSNGGNVAALESAQQMVQANLFIDSRLVAQAISPALRKQQQERT